MKFSTTLAGVAVVAVANINGATAFCAHGTTLHPRNAGAFKMPSWSYSTTGSNGPSHWHSMDSANSVCGVGTHQSPIDVHMSQVGTGDEVIYIPGSELKVEIPNVDGAEFQNLATTVEAMLNGTLTHDLNDNGEEVYRLAQMQFHTPGEHKIDGKAGDIEAHLVFQTASGSISVVALLLHSTLTKQRGRIFDDILSTVNKIDGPGEVTMTDPLSFAALTEHLNSNGALTYCGSLTTPPCKEGVRWLISSVPVSVSAAHVDAVRKILGYSARDVQGELGEPNLMADTANADRTTEATASEEGSMTTQTTQAIAMIGADGTSTLACSITTATAPDPAAPTTLVSQLPVTTPVSSGVWPQQPQFVNGTSKAN